VSFCGLDDPWVGEPDVRATFDGARAVIVSRGVRATESALHLFADPDARVITLGGR
jgi:hypothetical protein